MCDYKPLSDKGLINTTDMILKKRSLYAVWMPVNYLSYISFTTNSLIVKVKATS
jgi:hypothetical protein